MHSGILTAYFGWRSVFFVNVPIGFIGVLIAMRYVVNPTPVREGRFDMLGQLLGILFIAALAYFLIEIGRQDLFSRPILISFFLFLFGFILFLWVEHRRVSPMFPLNLFSSKCFSISVSIAMVLTLSIYGAMFVLTLYFQNVKHYTPLVTGFAFLPFMGLNGLGSYYSGRIVATMGAKKPTLFGLLFCMLGFFLLIPAMMLHAYAWLVLPLILIGVGSSSVFPAITVAAVQSAPQNRKGVAPGALNASRQLGVLLGVAIFGTLLTTMSSVMHGIYASFLIASVLLLIEWVAAIKSTVVK